LYGRQLDLFREPQYKIRDHPDWKTQLVEIKVNDRSEKVPAHSSLGDLIRRFGEDDPHLIVELNGRFVYPREYASTSVEENDRIEFINPNFGG
jgi:thiamine biosynthesis protein ThiS